MRLPHAAHANQPWRIHELTDGFRLEDVWVIRTPGAGRDDFPSMLGALGTSDASSREPVLYRLLFAARWKLGAVLGWDLPKNADSAQGPSLGDRLPSDLRNTRCETDAGLAPFTAIYELDDECAFELVNQTVHAVMHLGWVRGPGGDYELRMAVLVKPAGPLGRFYMAAVAPFRYAIVLPGLVHHWEEAWLSREHRQPDSVPAAMEGSVMGTTKVPQDVLDLSSLPDAHYADMFSLPTTVDATPEQWTRALFGDVPTLGESLIWRGLLGIRLSRGRSAETVAGWQIADRGAGWIRLEAGSWFMTCNLIVRTTEDMVSLATVVRYERRLGRLVWPPSSAAHRRLVPGLLRDAAKLQARAQAPGSPLLASSTNPDVSRSA